VGEETWFEEHDSLAAGELSVIRTEASDSFQNLSEASSVGDVEVGSSEEKGVLEHEPPLRRTQQKQLGPGLLQERGLVNARQLHKQIHPNQKFNQVITPCRPHGIFSRDQLESIRKNRRV